MASMSMRKVVSPRNIASAFVSPTVNQSLGVLLRHAQGESFRSPQSLQRSPCLSPFVAQTVSKDRSPIVAKQTSTILKKGKTVRKLPWSDGGEVLGVHALRPIDTLESFDECRHACPSADTPDRAEMLKKFKQKNNGILLGKGSFGSVVEALYKGKVVAVKIVQPTTASIRQIRNELNGLKLQHPNIVSMLKVVLPYDDIAGVVIMEKICGYTLQKLLDHGLLKDQPSKRIRYTMQLSCALKYCHDHGVLHLDMKPQNVIVENCSDSCKLCDFGCSSPIGAERPYLQGTVGYAAPEVLQGFKPTTAADVYSLGITMWQLISGISPYKGHREHTVIYKVVTDEYRPEVPTASYPQDEKYLLLIQKCWLQQPQCRPSIDQVLEELELTRCL
ncbi:Serine/threonine-protein kinase mos [Frankliniella fusca]|uniref:non-specific serine/threonine protein kinase n=1 Tax=Frankliniella fusca TaxID=407009 RepID=A0AAE1H0Z7_9NEOP|nr:Serine/threonine-protein kinase mos [Frankliniella fusca]